MVSFTLTCDAVMASGFKTRVSSNCNPSGVAEAISGDGPGKGITFTVTYAGC